nr:orotidine-5'-phosphate decarboxylase [Thalassobacillus pellis]
MINSQIYIALDFESGEKALAFLDEHSLTGVAVKVGMELFYREGPWIIKQLQKRGHPVFLDLKLHDIPNTVKKAMKNLASLGVDVVNVHAQGGSEMMKAAREGLDEGAGNGKRPMLLAVTQLTSTDEQMLSEELQVISKVEDSVIHLAKLAKESGADGVVCSVHEVAGIKASCGEEFKTVTPGIRLVSSEQHDQKRVATPKEAKRQTTDAIVVGRGITQHPSPKEAYRQVEKEWEYE